MYARWGKRAWWAAGVIAVLAAVGGGWYARTSTQVPTPAPLTQTEIARAGPIEPWWEPTPDQTAYAEETGQPLAIRNTQGQRFVLIPPGEFTLGLDYGNPPGNGLAPPHEVRLIQGFYAAATETTFAEYLRSDRSLPASTLTEAGAMRTPATVPVTNIDWFEAARYCVWLTDVERQAKLLGPEEEYRLPTELEWERACRAGSDTLFSFGDDVHAYEKFAWCEAPPRMVDPRWWPLTPSWGKPVQDATPHPVGQRLANAWGLYDMHGNVCEWTRSLWYPYPYPYNPPSVARELSMQVSPEREHRLKNWLEYEENSMVIIRGGSFADPSVLCASGVRIPLGVSNRSSTVGLRVIRASTG